ncbi:hypothetical protein CEXT_491311 [Caerostris extrusa]|uniref:Uncharacterized protein n=1 Tax=Caerostris extrusa TaxID=172846 RepID=A0AAV4SUR9_CAEEX|nr:hypothetical protein CEXT_491311 [Caerostris extrusa]
MTSEIVCLRVTSHRNGSLDHEGFVGTMRRDQLPKASSSPLKRERRNATLLLTVSSQHLLQQTLGGKILTIGSHVIPYATCSRERAVAAAALPITHCAIPPPCHKQFRWSLTGTIFG